MICSFYERNRASSQTHLFGAFVRHAKRAKKIPFFIREIGFNTLWWTEPFSVVLQISWSAAFPAALRPLARLSSPAVPPGRSFSRSSLCDHRRHWPSREYTIFDSQRFAPSTFGPAELPSPRYLEKLFMALRLHAPQASTDCPRPTSSRTLPALGPSLQRHHRCRYYSTDHLRLPRRHGGGLHPQEKTWPSFLCSDHLQRGTHRFKLRDGTQSRQCAPILWSLGFLRAGSQQAPFLHRFQAYPRAARWSLLRQKDCRIPRYKTAGLCRRGQNVPTVEEPYGRSSIPPLRSRVGGRRFYLHSLQLESGAPIRGRAQAHR